MFKSLLPAIIWTAIVFGLSIMPAIQLPETFLSPDKLAHLAVYAIMAFLWLWGFAKANALTVANTKWIILGCALFGCLMEIIQYAFFPGRFFEIGDNIANVIGCLLGYWGYIKLRIRN